MIVYRAILNMPLYRNVVILLEVLFPLVLTKASMGNS